MDNRRVRQHIDDCIWADCELRQIRDPQDARLLRLREFASTLEQQLRKTPGLEWGEIFGYDREEDVEEAVRKFAAAWATSFDNIARDSATDTDEQRAYVDCFRLCASYLRAAVDLPDQ